MLAIAGTGNMTIEGRLGYKRKVNAGNWSTMPENRQEAQFKKYLDGVTEVETEIESTCGNLTVTNPGRVKKKPK